MERRSLLRHSFNISLITLLSRLLGLVRVRLEAVVIGGGAVASGWFFAFSLPNLFRRLLGEGALGQALIPLVAEAEAKGGIRQVKRELAVIFAWLGIILGAIVVVLSLAAYLVRALTQDATTGYFAQSHVQIFLYFVPLLMPYAFFMCFTGAITSVLNYAKVFVLPALGSLLLNFFMIGGLYAILRGKFQSDDLIVNLRLLSHLVLLSGAVQLTMMTVILIRYRRFPAWKERHLVNGKEVLRKLFKILLPGLGSGALIQLSFLVDRAIATAVGPQAVPALTYVDRLIDVPIGIFAVSLSSVLMASMSRAAARGDHGEIVSELIYSLRQVFFISIPMAVIVIFFHDTMLRLLCFGGRYRAEDLAAAQTVAYFYGAAIPLFCAMKVIVPVFLARKKMLTTFYVSLIAITLNIILNLILMHPLKQGGIALATLGSTMISLVILVILLVREGFEIPFGQIALSFCRTTLIAVAVAFIVLATGWMRCHLEWSWSRQFGLFLASGVLFGILYLVFAVIARSPEIRELGTVLKRKSAAK